MEKPYVIRWILSNMVGFALAGAFMRFLVPSAALLGGLMGIAGGPGLLLSVVVQSGEPLRWQSVLIAGALAGVLSGVLVGGLSGFTQAWVLGWQGTWVEASLKGGVLGGLFAGLIGGTIANATGYGQDYGLPLDWIFRRSTVGVLSLAAVGATLGYGLGHFQRQVLEEAGHTAREWPLRSAMYGLVAWGLCAVYGETILGLMGITPESVILSFSPGASSPATLRNVLEPHLAAVANLMIVGVSYGALSVGTIRALLGRTESEPRPAKKRLSGRLIFLTLVMCGLIQFVTMVVAFQWSQNDGCKEPALQPTSGPTNACS